jgi:hypothetical protein
MGFCTLTPLKACAMPPRNTGWLTSAGSRVRLSRAMFEERHSKAISRPDCIQVACGVFAVHQCSRAVRITTGEGFLPACFQSPQKKSTLLLHARRQVDLKRSRSLDWLPAGLVIIERAMHSNMTDMAQYDCSSGGFGSPIDHRVASLTQPQAQC